MNEAQRFDELDIQLYAIMPNVRSKDIDIYNAADPTKISDKSSKKILRRIKREIKYIEAHENYRPAVEGWKRAAAVILVIMSVGFASVMTVEAARNAIWEAVTTWYKESIFLKYISDVDVATPEMLLEYKEPIVGDDYERYEVTKNDYKFVVEYESDLSLIIYQQSLLNDYEVWLSNHETEAYIVDINGCQGEVTSYVINGVQYSTIIWKDGSYAYMMSGNLSIDELGNIAKTIS